MNLSRLRPPAIVSVATLALVVGLGAPAVAHQVAHLISGSTIKPNTVTGKQVKESTLATVPRAKTATNAGRLGGKGPSAYAPEAAAYTSGMVNLKVDNTYHTFAKTGPVTWQARCGFSGQPFIDVQVLVSESTQLDIGPAAASDGADYDLSTGLNPFHVQGYGGVDTASELVSIGGVGQSGHGFVGELFTSIDDSTTTNCRAEVTASS